MGKGILFSLILLLQFIPLSRATSNSCVDDDLKFIKELFKKIKKEKDPKNLSPEFCWALVVCRYSYWQKNPPPKMDKNFECRTDVPKKMKCGLSVEEQKAIESYTNFHYSCLNNYLRQKTIHNKEMDSLVSTVNQALSKLPDYEGIVIRGAKLPPDVESLHKKGNIVTYNAFTSTSTTDLDWGDDKFVIISKTGKPIMDLAKDKAEYEVLFKAGTKFKVLDVEEGKRGKIYFLKEEMTNSKDPKQKEEDMALIKKLREQKANKSLAADLWNCPENNKVPSEVHQKILPKVLE